MARGPSGKRVLADNLRMLRLKQRLSQDALADEAGVTQALVSAIERGRANPTVESLERLALVLGVGIADLFDDAESRK
jgi:transcriptional regulator with XRE-family HTH domain